MKKMSLQLKPFRYNPGLQPLDMFGVQVWIQADTEQTGGAFNLFEILLPVGFETPLLIHYAEDVALHVLEGTLDVFWGTEKIQAQAGSFFFQPRDTTWLASQGNKTCPSHVFDRSRGIGPVRPRKQPVYDRLRCSESAGSVQNRSLRPITGLVELLIVRP